jgi:formamidopyrimidine-DNA glycosylase
MPEIPDLEGYRSYLNKRLPGHRIEQIERPIPWMVRAGSDGFEDRLTGQAFEHITRRGKLLLFPFDSGDVLVVHAMLTGRFEYCTPETRRRARTVWVMRLDNGMDFRYFDDRRMGRAYLVRPEELDAQVPRWSEMGPDVLDPALTEDVFVQRLNASRAQIKTVITTEKIIAGIGNAYSDEVLWEARIHPYRKRSEMSEDEVRAVFRAIHSVMDWATPIVTDLMETQGLPAHHYRDFLRVHRKGGEPCPRCGHHITEITSGQRITNFCRNCQT